MNEFEKLLATAVQWAEDGEATILGTGRPLTPGEEADATAMGVSEPGRIRVLEVDIIELPEALKEALTKGLGFEPGAAAAATLRYGILLRSDCARYSRFILRHEFVHTAQYETLGGIEPYMREYFIQFTKEGYAGMEFEMEAMKKAAGI